LNSHASDLRRGYRAAVQGPVHRDTGATFALNVLGAMDTSLFPSVRQMEPAPWYLIGTGLGLCQDPTNIELIVDTELSLEDGPEQAKETIQARNALTGRAIRVGPRMQQDVFTYPGIESDLGYLNYPTVALILISFSQCGKGIPCHKG
jgi:hypothetical protein